MTAVNETQLGLDHNRQYCNAPPPPCPIIIIILVPLIIIIILLLHKCITTDTHEHTSATY